jgi:DNA-binding transcriptional MerR regulator
MSTMRISQLAGRTGVPATTLRFYDTAGLVPAGRSPAGYRQYGDDAVERLTFIAAARRLGLSLGEIGELLGVREHGACADVKADLRPRVAARLADAERRAADLAAFTASLRAALDHLDNLPDRAEHCGPGCLPPADGAPRHELWQDTPVACSLGGDEQTARIAAWRTAFADATRQDIPAGVRLTLAADRAAAVAELAAAEQRCCPFLDLRLIFAGPSLHLEVRAGEAGRDLLADLFGAA